MSSPLIHGGRGAAKAFTLIELLTVIAIVGILAAITFGIANSVREQSAISQARTELATLSLALENYKRQYGDYPQPANGTWAGMSTGTAGNQTKLLQALIGKRGPLGAPISGKGFIETAKFSLSSTADPADPANQDSVKLIDPWGRDYYYFYKESSSWTTPGFILMSAGPNGFSYATNATAAIQPASNYIVLTNGTLRSDASTNSGSADNVYSNL